MDMPINQITSQDLIPIEQHYRVSAGPGAGKTHWLVSHIRNVLQNSKRLGCNKKIACITYTNVAVDTIVKRLNFVADRVEVSTIHGFIYKNIIRPYFSFISNEYEFNITKLDGHDDHYPSRSKTRDWVTNHPNVASLSHPYSLNQLTGLDNNLRGLSNWLSSISYVLDNGQAKLTIDNSKAFYMDGGTRKNIGKIACLDKLAPGLMEYKKIFWRKGTMHHDDVLFFGYILLTRFPFIITILQSKFPYFFIDEFQDTSPIQAEILRLLGQNETVVGIIGDKAQSIYSFQGASPRHFEQFTLNNLGNYQISDNRRSTNSILDVLNHIRKDINQRAIRNIPGDKPSILVGSMNWAFQTATAASNDENVASLSRDNMTSNAMKRLFTSSLPPYDLIVELISKDSNSDRRKAILSSLNALELAKQKRFKEGIKEMERNFFGVRNRDDRKKIAFAKLSFLLSKYDEYRNKKLYDFYELVKANIRQDISGLRKGAILDFYNNHTYEEIAVNVKIMDDNSLHRTIHKAKGDEFDNVLVLLKEQGNLNFLTNPNLDSEEHRILYVAVSRSREKLFISVPHLDPQTQNKLSVLFDVRHETVSA